MIRGTINGGPVFVAVLRNCGRCFKDFHGDSFAKVCMDCRKPPPPKEGVKKGAKLAPRELQIVPLVAEGLTSKIVAYRLHLAEGTIKVYLNRIYVKTGLTNRTELAAWWIRRQQAAPATPEAQS